MPPHGGAEQTRWAFRANTRTSYNNSQCRLNTRRSCAPLYRAVRIAYVCTVQGVWPDGRRRAWQGAATTSARRDPGHAAHLGVVAVGTVRRAAATPASRRRGRTFRGGYSEAGAPEAEAPQGSQREARASRQARACHQGQARSLLRRRRRSYCTAPGHPEQARGGQPGQPEADRPGSGRPAGVTAAGYARRSRRSHATLAPEAA